MNLETASENIRTMDEAVKAAAINDKRLNNLLKTIYFLKEPVV